MDEFTAAQTNKGRDPPESGCGSQQSRQDEADNEETQAALRMVQAAMMEELGIGRKDTLPLQDSGLDVDDLHYSKPTPRRQLARNGNDVASAWRNAVFDDVDPAEAELDSIADGQLYRMRRGAPIGNHQSSSGRGSHNIHKQSFLDRGSPRGNHQSVPNRSVSRGNYQSSTTRGAYHGTHQSSPVRGGSSQGSARTRGAISKRGGHVSYGTRSSPNNRANTQCSIYSPQEVSLASKRVASNDARNHSNQGNPRVKLAIERLQYDVKSSMTGNQTQADMPKKSNRQAGSGSRKSKPITRANSGPPPRFALSSTSSGNARQIIGDKPFVNTGAMAHSMAGSRYASDEAEEAWRLSRRAPAPATESSFGDLAEVKETRIKFRKQSETKHALGTLRLVKYENVETLSIEICSDGQVVLNDTLYSESGLVVDVLPAVTYRPALQSSEAWIIHFCQPYIADQYLSLVQQYQFSAPSAPFETAAVSSLTEVLTSNAIEKPNSATAIDAIRQGEEVFQLAGGPVDTHKPNFTISTKDEEWLVEYFGNAAKTRIMELHSKILLCPNAKTDVFGSVWSGTVPSEDIRTEMHQEIHRIFQARLDTKFHPGNRKIQIRAAPTSDHNSVNEPTTLEQIARDAKEIPSSSHEATFLGVVGDSHLGTGDGSSGQTLVEISKVAGLGQLISFSDHGDEVEPVKMSEYIQDLIDIEVDGLLEGVYIQLRSNSQGSIIEQLSTLVPAQARNLAREMTRDEFLSSKPYYAAAMNLVGGFLSSSGTFSALPDEYGIGFVQDKTRKIYERAIDEFILKREQNLENETNYLNENSNNFEDSPKESSEYKPIIGLEASKWAPQEVKDQYAAKVAKNSEEATAGATTKEPILPQKVKYTMEALVTMKDGAIPLSPTKLSEEVAHLYRLSQTAQAARPKIGTCKNNSAFAVQTTIVPPKPNLDSPKVVGENGILPLSGNTILVHQQNLESRGLNPDLSVAMLAVVDRAKPNEAAVSKEFEPTSSENGQIGKDEDLSNSTLVTQLHSQALQITGSLEQNQNEAPGVQQFAAGGPGAHESMSSQNPSGTIRHNLTNSDLAGLALQLDGLNLGTQFSPDGLSSPSALLSTAQRRLQVISNHLFPPGLGVATAETRNTEDKASEDLSSVVAVFPNQPLTAHVAQPEQLLKPSDGILSEPSIEQPKAKTWGGLADSKWANVPDSPPRPRLPVILRDDPLFRPTFYAPQAPKSSMLVPRPANMEALGFIPLPLQPVIIHDTDGRPVRDMGRVLPHNSENTPLTASVSRGRSEDAASPSARTALSPVRQGDNLEAKLNSRLKKSLADRGGSKGAQQ